jgi:hypothetical protein
VLEDLRERVGVDVEPLLGSTAASWRSTMKGAKSGTRVTVVSFTITFPLAVGEELSAGSRPREPVTTATSTQAWPNAQIPDCVGDVQAQRDREDSPQAGKLSGCRAVYRHRPVTRIRWSRNCGPA